MTRHLIVGLIVAVLALPAMAFGQESPDEYLSWVRYYTANPGREADFVKLINEISGDTLNEMVAEAKTLGRKYDAIVPLSGGRDSSYVLYVVAVEYGMKVLAISYDNEFRHDQAMVNMRTACDRGSALGPPGCFSTVTYSGCSSSPW